MAKARLIIEQFIEEHQSVASTLQVVVPSAAFPLVIGYKGAKAQEIALASGAKFDLDRGNEVANLKGSQEACRRAADMIHEILVREGLASPSMSPSSMSKDGLIASSGAFPEADEDDDDGGVDDGGGAGVDQDDVTKGGNGLKLPPGATPAMIARMQELSMSKSAARRKRRKEQQTQGK